MQTQQSVTTIPDSRGWRKNRERALSERVVVMLNPVEFESLESLADGEPYSAYLRRLFRAHLKKAATQG